MTATVSNSDMLSLTEGTINYTITTTDTSSNVTGGSVAGTTNTADLTGSFVYDRTLSDISAVTVDDGDNINISEATNGIVLSGAKGADEGVEIILSKAGSTNVTATVSVDSTSSWTATISKTELDSLGNGDISYSVKTFDTVGIFKPSAHWFI